jgi:transcriptional regulator with XRE-family HTH domain
MTVDRQTLDTHSARTPSRIKGFAALAAEARELEAEIMSSFGDRLKKARKDKGLEQTDIATIQGVSVQTISLWERGRVTPEYASNPKRFLNLAKALGVQVEWLLYGVRSAGSGAADPRVERIKEIMHEFSRHYPGLAEMLEALAKSGLAAEDLDGLREKVKGLRQVYRDLEDALDS